MWNDCGSLASNPKTMQTLQPFQTASKKGMHRILGLIPAPETKANGVSILMTWRLPHKPLQTIYTWLSERLHNVEDPKKKALVLSGGQYSSILSLLCLWLRPARSEATVSSGCQTETLKMQHQLPQWYEAAMMRCAQAYQLCNFCRCPRLYSGCACLAHKRRHAWGFLLGEEKLNQADEN